MTPTTYDELIRATVNAHRDWLMGMSRPRSPRQVRHHLFRRTR